MGFTTKNDIMKKWETPERREEAKKIDAIRKDINTARSYIADSLIRYKKKKLKAKSMKKAVDNPFSELEEWTTQEDIHDAFGWGVITEAKMERLLELWELREQGEKKSGDYQDRVTEMLERALRSVGEEYDDILFEYDQRQREMEREAETVARENNERTQQRMFG